MFWTEPAFSVSTCQTTTVQIHTLFCPVTFCPSPSPHLSPSLVLLFVARMRKTSQNLQEHLFFPLKDTNIHISSLRTAFSCQHWVLKWTSGYFYIYWQVARRQSVKCHMVQMGGRNDGENSVGKSSWGGEEENDNYEQNWEGCRKDLTGQKDNEVSLCYLSVLPGHKTEQAAKSVMQTATSLCVYFL